MEDLKEAILGPESPQVHQLPSFPETMQSVSAEEKVNFIKILLNES